MSAKLVFSFEPDVTGEVAVHTVATFFGLAVSIEPAGEAAVPAYIKQAVENTAAALNNPAHGVEQSPAIAFGGLVNGAGNVAPSSVDVAALPTAHVVTPGIPVTLPGASLAPAPQIASTGADAHAESAAPGNPAASVDATGLPWDERIHSSKRTQNPDGTWRKRKGVTPPMVAKVEAELRSSGNGVAVAAASGASSAVSTAVLSKSPVSTTDRKAEAIAHANAEAMRVAGTPSPISDAMLTDLLNGKTHTLTPVQAEWFNVFFAKRNAAFAAFMQTAPITVTPAGPGATAIVIDPAAAVQASPLPTGNAPVVAAVPPAPASFPTTAVTPQLVSGAELDATGLPHDTRINVGAKIKDAAGVWVQRHDVDPATKLQIMAELRAALAGNAAVNAPAIPAGESSPVAAPATAAPAITADEARGNFAKLMQWVVANTNAQRITQSDAVEAATMLGFPNLAALAQQQPYLTYVVDALIAKGAV